MPEIQSPQQQVLPISCDWECGVPWCQGTHSEHATCMYAESLSRNHRAHRDNMLTFRLGPNVPPLHVCAEHWDNLWSRRTTGNSYRRCRRCLTSAIAYQNQQPRETYFTLTRQTIPRSYYRTSNPCYQTVSNSPIRFYCGICQEELLWSCLNCGVRWERAGTTVWTTGGGAGEVFCSADCLSQYQGTYDDSHEDCDCDDCMDRDGAGGGRFIHYAHWRPSPLVFYPQLEPPKNKFYIGMEIEVGWDRGNYDRGELEAWWSKWSETNTFWVVEDGSVRGFEVNTNPFNPDWALAGNFPFAAFDELVDKYHADPSHESAGTHIHVNKAAFNSSHLWKFLQLHQRMPNFCGQVGGRGTRSEWGSFGSNWQEMRPDIAKFAKDKTPYGYARYVAVNLGNEDTLEMRYMAGGTTSKLIKKNMQWAKGLYEFTEELTVADVQRGFLDHPRHIIGWLAKRKDQYKELINYITENGSAANKDLVLAAMAAESVG